MSFNPHVLSDLGSAAARLEEALKLEKTDIVRDSAIKRFELCFDLAWKCIQSHARKEGLECHSPKACLKLAFQLNLIDYEDEWLKMLDDRNLSVHTYRVKYAEEIYGRLKPYAQKLKDLFRRISEAGRE